MSFLLPLFLFLSLKNLLITSLYFFKLKNRKRGKRKDIFSLPIPGQNAKFRVKRANQIDILANEDIATKTFFINNKLVSVPYFSKNVLPLKIEDIINILKLDESAKYIYEVEIDTHEVKDYIKKLTYFLTEASRLTIKATLYKKSFNINFDEIKEFNGKTDEVFRKFLQEYIQNKNSKLYPYIGSIRGGLEGKATLLKNTNDFITLEYKAEMSGKKSIIIKNL